MGLPDRGPDHSVPLGRVEGFLDRLRRQEGLHHLVHVPPGLRLLAEGGVGVARVLEVFRHPELVEHCDDSLPLTGKEAQHHLHVLAVAAEHFRREWAALVDRPRHHVPREVVLGAVIGRGVVGEIDPLTPARLLPVGEGGEYVHRPQAPRDVRGLVRLRRDGRRVPHPVLHRRVAGDHHLPAQRQHDEVAPLVAGPRPIGPEVAEGQDDESGRLVVDTVPRQPDTVEPAWAQTLDENIAAFEQAAQRLQAVGRLNVQRDAAFALVVVPPEQARFARGLVPVERPDAPPRRAFGRLDGDDVRAKPREQLAAERAALVADLDDTHAGERMADSLAKTVHQITSSARRASTSAALSPSNSP